MDTLQEKNKYILVTGGAGFIGSHVVDTLAENQYSVIVVDKNKPKHPNKNATYFQFDINSDDKLEEIFKKYKIENIVHLAAQVSVSYSFKDKIYDAQNNIICSIKLCNLAKKYDVKKMIVSSTAAVYGAPERLPIDEEHPVSCQSPYAISKYSMEEYLRISDLDYIVCRFSNVYGPRQDTQGEAGVIAIFADKISKNEEIEIHGDGQQIRDFIFVKDVAFAIQKCIEKDVKNQTINISTNTQCTINELFENLKEIASYTKTPKYTEERIGDIKISVLDNSKAKALLDWDCQAEFKKGLKETIEYLRDYKID